MEHNNKAILQKANAAIVKGDKEGFLIHCADDTEWNFVGDKTIRGKQSVREWMELAYKKPPQFTVENLIGDGDTVVALGKIWVVDDEGTGAWHKYCDVWQFRDGKMLELKAFVIKPAKGE